MWNESATQNADVAFQLQAIGQQLELLSRTYKDMKDEVNSIKQQNSGADRRGNTVCIAVRNVRFDFEEFVDDNAEAGEDDYDFASLAKESGLDRTRLGGMWISVAWALLKIWMGTFFFKLTYVLKEEDTNIIRGIPQIYNDNRNIKQQMATG